MSTRLVIGFCFVLALAGWAASSALAQPTQNPPQNQPKENKVFPGKGPQIAFDEARWEFWWFYNKEPLLGLRPRLKLLSPGQSDADVSFQPLTDRDVSDGLVPKLLDALKDANPEVRIQAIYSLAKTRDAGIRTLLGKQVYDTQFLVRLNALISLGVWGQSFYLGRLEEVVRDDKAELQERMYAALAIGLIGGDNAAQSMRALLSPASFKMLPPMVEAGLAYSAGLGKDLDTAAALRALFADSKLNDHVVRSYLALSIGKVGDASDAPALLQALFDKESQLRRSAAIALGVLLRKSGDESASKMIRSAAQTDGDLMVKNFCYITLGWIAGAENVKFLRAELEQVVKAQRAFVALGIGLIGDAESVPLLLRHLGNETENSYRSALAVAIGMHHDNRAAPDLRKAFRSESEPVTKGYFALALGMVGDVEAIPELKEVFKTANDVELIPNTATALGLLGDRTSEPVLAERVVSEKNEFVRASLLFALGLIGDRAAMAPLTAVLGQTTEPAYVRGYAVTGLGLLGEQRDVRAISRLSCDSNYTIVSDFLHELFTTL